MVETGSTNADLLTAAAAGAPTGSVLVTDHQTAGRGRQSRSWHDEPGAAVLLSVLLRPPAAIAPLVPLLMGLAALDALDSVLDRSGAEPTSRPARNESTLRPALKWPNDLIVPGLGDRKLAGILAEAVTAGRDAALVVVVGMGLNLGWSIPPPAEIAARAATLEELAGWRPDRWEVVGAVLRALDRWLGVADDGPEAVLGPYRERCATIGRRVKLDTATGIVEGTAVGIAPSGGLMVDSDGRSVELLAGDAHHR